MELPRVEATPGWIERDRGPLGNSSGASPCGHPWMTSVRRLHRRTPAWMPSVRWAAAAGAEWVALDGEAIALLIPQGALMQNGALMPASSSVAPWRQPLGPSSWHEEGRGDEPSTNRYTSVQTVELRRETMRTHVLICAL